MFDVLAQINWIAVAVATLASSVFGGLWFTVLFGKQYAAALGQPHPPKEKPAPIFILGPLVCSLVSIVTSAVLMRSLHVSTVAQALGFGTIVGVGYFVATMTNTAINPNMPRPFAYSLVSGPYFVASSLMTSFVLVCIP